MAALSWRLPERVRRTRPAVLPDQTGIGAIPACRAKAASDLNRHTPAASPTILAAVNAPTPGIASRLGAVPPTTRSPPPLRPLARPPGWSEACQGARSPRGPAPGWGREPVGQDPLM